MKKLSLMVILAALAAGCSSMDSMHDDGMMKDDSMMKSDKGMMSDDKMDSMHDDMKKDSMMKDSM